MASILFNYLENGKNHGKVCWTFLLHNFLKKNIFHSWKHVVTPGFPCRKFVGLLAKLSLKWSDLNKNRQ